MSNVVVLSMERMSAWRAMVRSPPSVGAPPPAAPESLELPPPHAVSASAATAATPTDLIRVARVIDCLIVLPAAAGGWGVIWPARSAGTGGPEAFVRPGGATVAFITLAGQDFVVVTFETRHLRVTIWPWSTGR
ncbi:exported protein of unknown function [Modestobacter italicus]|uniref:Uncharacterized protein n=1 Tax=Modestobacter italicus (strain DSM 44449 / CECT 9708 / BC 501) TaxID=2732864 RepID=I4F1B7_MODI5|nr:exported protein of unknown function [Modestobacter marinus]